MPLHCLWKMKMKVSENQTKGKQTLKIITNESSSDTNSYDEWFW